MEQDEKAAVRAAVFGHLAGVVLAPTVKALADRKVFDLFQTASARVDLDQVVEHTRGNRGYLRVALRLLSACGWLQQRSEHDGPPTYALTSEGRIAIQVAPALYGQAISFIPKAVFLEDFLFGNSDAPVLPSLQALVARVKERWGIGSSADPATANVCGQICTHLDGMLVGPALVALARGGVLQQLAQGPAKVSTRSQEIAPAWVAYSTCSPRKAGLAGNATPSG